MKKEPTAGGCKMSFKSQESGVPGGNNLLESHAGQVDDTHKVDEIGWSEVPGMKYCSEICIVSLQTYYMTEYKPRCSKSLQWGQRCMHDGHAQERGDGVHGELQDVAEHVQTDAGVPEVV